MTRSMNQEKIGKLIAKLRKEKGLTQRELGEMVGVGYRAVSKWETGLTMPDISIINELSTILGISSDELLKGEQCSKDAQVETPIVTKKPTNKRKLLFILIPILLIIAVALVITNNRVKPKEYAIKSSNHDQYKINGKLTIDGNNMTIKIDKIEFQDYIFLETMIKDYEYSLILDGYFIFGINKSNEYMNVGTSTSIKEFSDNFKILYHNNTFIKEHKKITKGNLKIKLKFYKTDGSTVTKNIETIITNKQ